MSITNPWLTPYQRSYQQIKAKLIDDLKNITDSSGKTLVTDYSEGNILIIILSLFSAIAEVLHYYIDNMARETFFSTARRYDSLVKHGELVDYHVRGAVAPTVDVVISRPINSSSSSGDITISKGTSFTDTSGNTWLVTNNTIWGAGTTSVSVPCSQHKSYTNSSVVNMVIPNWKVNPPARIKVDQSNMGDQHYENGTMELRIAGTLWTLVETFAFSGKYDTHYRVEIDSNKDLYIVFGDGQYGMIPDPGQKITTCNCYITAGKNGNVEAGSLTTLPSTISQACSDGSCTNPYAAAGGSDYEDFDMLKEHIPLHTRTLGVAITKYDFINLAKQVSGVNKVALEYECGRKLNLYITPDNGTVASSALLQNTYDYIKQRCPITTWLNVKPVGEVSIYLVMEVTGRKNYTKTTIYNQVVNALKETYSVTAAEIGGKVRISDIYALIDNLPGVDYLTITSFYWKPWPTTLNGPRALNIQDYSVSKVTGNNQYLVVFTSSTNYNIYNMAGGYSTTGTVNNSLKVTDNANGNTFAFTIKANSHASGDRFSFTVAAPNMDYSEPGYNIPVFKNANQISLTINEVL